MSNKINCIIQIDTPHYNNKTISKINRLIPMTTLLYHSFTNISNSF